MPLTADPRRLTRTIALALLSSAVGVSAFSSIAVGQQGDEQRRLERSLRAANDELADYRLKVDTNLSLEERTIFEVGGFLSGTGLWLDDSSNNSRRLFQPELSLFGRASIDGVHTGFLRLRFPYRDFSPGDSFDGKGDTWDEPFIDRYSYEFDLRRAIAAYEGRRSDFNFNIKIGRQFVDWGAGLALSETLLSIRPTLSFGDRLEVEGLISVTPESAIDFDSSREEFDTNTKRGYYGAKVQYTTETGRRYYIYGLYENDDNTDGRLRDPIPGIATADFSYDATYVGIGTEGSFGPDITYLAEFVYEFGSSMSDPVRSLVQTEEDISAFALRAQGTYLLRDNGLTRFQFETLVASGDSDRGSSTDTVNGNLEGTTDNGFNGLGFANTGLSFAPSLSNLWTLRAGVATFPMRNDPSFQQLQVGADVLVFNKFEKNGGFDEDTTNDMFLGSELDFFANWRVTSDFAVNLRYGVFFPGTAIAGSKSARNYVLVGFTLSF